jgi:hypothetical protein
MWRRGRVCADVISMWFRSGHRENGDVGTVGDEQGMMKRGNGGQSVRYDA